jgi:preprotein translocase subunit SecG
MLRTVLTIVQVFASLAIVALVLLQRGRGADAGAGFGAGASGSVFGARGATTGLSRSTAIFAAIFMVNSLALAWLGSRPSETAPRGLLEQSSTTAPAAPAQAPAVPAGTSVPTQVAPGASAPPTEVPAAPAPQDAPAQ